MTVDKDALLAGLASRDAAVLAADEGAAAEKQHARGSLTARERMGRLFDAGSFHEVGRLVRHHCTDFGMAEKELPADGVITGYGNVDGRLVFAYAQEFGVAGGSMGRAHGTKVCRLLDMAAESGAPVVGLCNSGGARIQEGVAALSAYGDIFRHNCRYSGVIPQVSVVFGPCAGGASFSPTLTDFTIMVEGKGEMYVNGPAVVRTITGQDFDAEDLGGSTVHLEKSGVAHFGAPDDASAIELAKRLLSYLPSCAGELPPVVAYASSDEVRPELRRLMPVEGEETDVHEVIYQLLDEGSFLEVQPAYAPNIVVGLGRMAGRSVGVIANNRAHLDGALSIDACDKASHLARTCNAFGIPLLFLADAGCFYPSAQEAWGGNIRHGAEALRAVATASVPKLTVILGRDLGGCYMAMCSKGMGADLVLAWPSAEIAVMGAEGAARIVFPKEIAASQDPAACQAQKVREYREKFASPYQAASLGYVDSVIDPAETRQELISALDALCRP